VRREQDARRHLKIVQRSARRTCHRGAIHAALRCARADIMRAAQFQGRVPDAVSVPLHWAASGLLE
jgi:hypothetical protein